MLIIDPQHRDPCRSGSAACSATCRCLLARNAGDPRALPGTPDHEGSRKVEPKRHKKTIYIDITSRERKESTDTDVCCLFGPVIYMIMYCIYYILCTDKTAALLLPIVIVFGSVKRVRPCLCLAQKPERVYVLTLCEVSSVHLEAGGLWE